MMTQSFRYPNLVGGTDAWSDWWTPSKGVINAGIHLYTVTFPRELASGDVVSASMEMQFDGLVLGTADTDEDYNLRLQGPANGKWNSGLDNIVVAALQPWGDVFADGTYSGTKFFSGTVVVNDGNGFAGTTEDEVGVRIDNCGGGEAPRAPAHGHAQRGRRPARLGTSSRGGVAVDE